MRQRIIYLGVVLLVSSIGEPALAGTEPFDKAAMTLVTPYLKVHNVLIADSVDGIKPAAAQIVQIAKTMDPKTVTGPHKSHYATLPKKIEAAAGKLGKAKDLDTARAAFKELSRPLVMWATLSKPKGIHVLYCDMAKGSWLQQNRAVRNPYYGSSMLKCGQVVSDRPATK